MQKIIKIENLNLFYGENQALFDINVEIEANKVTALIGPSGCGKSTFLRCLNRMNDLIPICRTEGRILFQDKDIMKKKVDVNQLRTEIGMVFQKPNPFPMSIYDNVAYGARALGIKNKVELDKIVETSLKEAALWDEVSSNLNKSGLGLSGGQQQRLCIARAIAVKPDVILMDEPTSALDPIATGKIEELINVLKMNYTVIIVTHSMQQAARISDYTAFFLAGKILEFDQTKKLFSKPKNQKTEDYITGRFG